MSGSTTVDLAPRRQLGALQAILVVGAICEAAVPWLIGRTLSLATGSPVRLAITVIGFAVTLGLIVLCNVTAYLWLNRLRITMIARLRADVGKQIFDGAAAPTQRTGDIATIVSTDVPNIAAFALARVRLVSAVTGFVAVAGYLLLISPVLAIVVIAGVPLLMYLTKLVSEPLDGRQAEHRRLLGITAAYTLDIGQGIRVLRAINGAPEFGRRFHHTSLETQRAGIRVAKSQALLQCTSLVLPGVLVLGVVWLGGALAGRGSISPAELVTFYAGAAYLVAPITQFASYLSARSEARVGQQNLDVLLNIADQGAMPAQPATSQLASAGVLRDDRFGIAVPARSFCVVRCPDGDTAEQAGRSLAALDRSSQATLNGRRLADYPEAAIRNTVRFQGHQTALFAGTLRASIDPHGAHTDQELLASLAIADATEIVARLADGLDSRVESGGRNLSGGQRRRLALARALIGEPAYLILVEPTVGLDAVTEEIVVQNLAAHRTGHSTVIFTSDTAFDSVADRVIVLRPDQLSGSTQTGSEQGSAGVLR